MCRAVLRDFRSSSTGKEGFAALPEVDGPDVLLDAGCRVQHLATVFPKAFEHHLHGVLQEEEKTTSQSKQTHPITFLSPLLLIFFTRESSRLACSRQLNSGEELGKPRLLPFLHKNQALLMV